MKEWYLARGEQKYGPYSTTDIIQLRQHRKAFEYDLVWKQGLRQWKPLIQTEEFSAHAMAERAAKAEHCAVFNRRHWPRVRKEIPLLVHNEKCVWQARSLNISRGGAMIELNSPYLNPGDLLHIHFQASEESEHSFSCLSAITAKRFNNERIRFNSTHQYSVRFDSKDPGADEQIELWVQKILQEKTQALSTTGVTYDTTNR